MTKKHKDKIQFKNQSTNIEKSSIPLNTLKLIEEAEKSKS